MTETWKYWLQLMGIMPSDELQKLRAENELLKAQLRMHMDYQMVRKWNPAIQKWEQMWVNPVSNGPTC